jgi:hypothetical protein
VASRVSKGQKRELKCIRRKLGKGGTKEGRRNCRGPMHLGIQKDSSLSQESELNCVESKEYT